MNYLLIALQILVSLGLLNVWLLRFNQRSKYRGGSAQNLTEEFKIYQLPTWFMYAVGTLKIGSAIALLLGLYYPSLIVPSSAIVVLLMFGAMLMHAKVKDSMLKYIPALVMFLMGLAILLISSI